MQSVVLVLVQKLVLNLLSAAFGGSGCAFYSTSSNYVDVGYYIFPREQYQMNNYYNYIFIITIIYKMKQLKIASRSSQSYESSKIQIQNSGVQPTTLDLFKEQMLRAWQPVPSLTKTIIMFFIMAVVFLGIGIPMIVLSNQIIQVSVRYDNVCSINNICTISLNIPVSMPGPVFFYYEFHNYYQNHRLYARSLSIKQLKGNILSASQISTDCSPIVYNRNLNTNKSITNVTLLPDEPANPCGLIAFTVPNDTYSISNVTFSYDGLIWQSDIKKYVISNSSLMWTDITTPRFINWMRIAAVPNFRKLEARINNGLPAGNYTMTIGNYYDISRFKGEKYITFSTSNFFGSRNEFLSITYIVVGVLCFTVGSAFLIKKLMKKNKQQ